jgi:aspartyl-tRNA(Asn)/glutamyl-tRNA(Gln) amidotransferase subunit C
MSLQPEDVRGIGHLARLDVNPADVERYAVELTAILELVERMNAAETAGVEPMAHPLDEVQRLRPDEVTEAVDRERFQAVAPRVKDGLYLVPRVIE